MNDPCWGFPHNYSHVTEHDFKTTAIPFPFNSSVKFSTILCFIILSIIGCANDVHFKILAVNLSLFAFTSRYELILQSYCKYKS